MDVLPYSVVKIDGQTAGRPGVTSAGTGFFFRVNVDDTIVPMIVTNRHVVANMETLSFHMSLADSNGERILGPAQIITVPTSGYPILLHPDPGVDLAMIPAQPINEIMHREGSRPYFLTLSKDNFPAPWLTKKLSAFTNTIMIGFPNGLMDLANNLPISRRGTLATHYFADYNGKKDFVVDIAAFGGSSGSPVFAYFDTMTPTEDGMILGDSSVRLIGILHSGPILSAMGEVVPAPIPTTSHVSKTNLMMHLGYCAKAELLNDFEPLIATAVAEEKRQASLNSIRPPQP